MRSGPGYPRGPGAASSAQRGTLRSDTIGATYTQDPRHLATRRLPSMRGAIAPIKTLPRSESAQLDRTGRKPLICSALSNVFGIATMATKRTYQPSNIKRQRDHGFRADRKSVVEGKSVSVSVDHGGRRS